MVRRDNLRIYALESVRKGWGTQPGSIDNKLGNEYNLRLCWSTPIAVVKVVIMKEMKVDTISL